MSARRCDCAIPGCLCLIHDVPAARPAGGAPADEITEQVQTVLDGWWIAYDDGDGARILARHAAEITAAVLAVPAVRAALDAQAAVNALGPLVARLRAVLDLAEELDREAEARGLRLDRCIPPGDRLRAAVTAAQEGAGQA